MRESAPFGSTGIVGPTLAHDGGVTAPRRRPPTRAIPARTIAPGQTHDQPKCDLNHSSVEWVARRLAQRAESSQVTTPFQAEGFRRN